MDKIQPFGRALEAEPPPENLKGSWKHSSVLPKDLSQASHAALGPLQIPGTARLPHSATLLSLDLGPCEARSGPGKACTGATSQTHTSWPKEECHDPTTHRAGHGTTQD